MKKYNPKKEAEEFSKVLKYNPELLTDSRLSDLAIAIEIRLMQAFDAGQDAATSGSEPIPVLDISEAVAKVNPPKIPFPPPGGMN